MRSYLFMYICLYDRTFFIKFIYFLTGFRIRIFFLRIRIRAKIFMRIRIRFRIQFLGVSGGGGWGSREKWIFFWVFFTLQMILNNWCLKSEQKKWNCLHCTSPTLQNNDLFIHFLTFLPGSGSGQAKNMRILRIRIRIRIRNPGNIGSTFPLLRSCVDAHRRRLSGWPGPRSTGTSRQFFRHSHNIHTSNSAFADVKIPCRTGSKIPFAGYPAVIKFFWISAGW